MKTKSETVHHEPSRYQKALWSYVAGFLLSVLLTIIPYLLVINQILSSEVLFTGVILFALAQLLVQLVFFFHLGNESERLNLIALIVIVFNVVVLVGGSLWIMAHLNYNMMPQAFHNGIVAPQTQKASF